MKSDGDELRPLRFCIWALAITLVKLFSYVCDLTLNMLVESFYMISHSGIGRNLHLSATAHSKDENTASFPLERAGHENINNGLS